MPSPNDYKYSKEHTWLKLLGQNEGLVGITDFAQNQLSEIVEANLPQIGERFAMDQSFATLEAVKTASDLFMPVDGEIIAVNERLQSEVTLINSAAFTDGWIIKIRMTDPQQVDALLDSAAYDKISL